MPGSGLTQTPLLELLPSEERASLPWQPAASSNAAPAQRDAPRSFPTGGRTRAHGRSGLRPGFPSWLCHFPAMQPGPAAWVSSP